MSVATYVTVKPADMSPGKRCPDFDADCRDVTDHLRCWNGLTSDEYFTGPADGFCPYVIGMMGVKP